MINPIREYYQQIQDGKATVGRWIRAIYAIIIKWLDEGFIVYDEEKAKDAIEYIETRCFHTEGPLAPNSLKLELWQKSTVACIFGLLDKDGQKRQFREVLLLEGRKNGKSSLASAIAKYATDKLKGFGKRGYCTAPKLDQASIIYDGVWQMFQVDPIWIAEEEAIKDSIQGHNKKTEDDSMHARKRASDIFIPGTNSSFKKQSFSERKSDGFNPLFVCCDEIAAWSGDKGLKQYEVWKSAGGSREMGDEPMIILSCTTSGYQNDSIFDELMKRATRFLLGDSEETKLLPFLYMIDDVEKWDDLEELKKSNPNLGVSVSEDYLKEEIKIAKGSLSKKAEFLTKYCCIKQNSSLAWLPSESVQQAVGAPVQLEDFKNCYCIVGLDLSRTTDLTAVTALIERNGKIYIVARFFLPREKLEEATARDNLPYEIYAQRGLLTLSGDNFVDYHDAYNWICSLVRDYKIYPLKVMYDRYSAQYLIQELQAAGFQCDDCFQGENMTPGIREFEGLMKNGQVEIGDNDLLKVHLLNAALKMNSETERVKLIKMNANAHVDGVAAILDAMIGRQKWWAEIGSQLQNVR